MGRDAQAQDHLSGQDGIEDHVFDHHRRELLILLPFMLRGHFVRSLFHSVFNVVMHDIGFAPQAGVRESAQPTVWEELELPFRGWDMAKEYAFQSSKHPAK